MLVKLELEEQKKEENPDEYPESAFYVFELKQNTRITGETEVAF